jgi:uracil-DNA glycosylase
MIKLDWEKFEPLFDEWAIHFKPLFEKTDVMDKIYEQLKHIGRPRSQGGLGRIICPDSNNTFRAFSSCPPSLLKVVWILLDPYPSIHYVNKGTKDEKMIKTSNGIAMDCSNRGILQPSLEKFYEGIEQQYHNGFNLNMLKPASLEYLYNQGNMFLNSALTVEANATGSHTEIWQPFMKYFLEEVMSLFTGIIYVLCGKDSQKLEKYIKFPLGNYIIKIEHPSYAARQHRDWEYEDVFKKIDYILKHNNNMKMQWVMDKETPF